MKEWGDFEWLMLVTVVCVLLLIVVFAAVVGSGAEPKEHIRRDCQRAGYLDYEVVGRTCVCVGVIDGRYTVEPLEDVRARLEAN